MTTLTDLQLVNVRWNEASTAVTTGQNLADLDNLPVTFNIKTVTGYVIGEKDGAKVVAQIQLLDAVYIPLGAVLDVIPVDSLIVAPSVEAAIAEEVAAPVEVPADVPVAEVLAETVEGGETA